MTEQDEREQRDSWQALGIRTDIRAHGSQVPEPRAQLAARP
jgi:hypothetical protein